MTVTAAAGRMWGLSPEAPAAALRQQSSHSQPGDGSHRRCLPVMDEGINLSRMHLISLKKSRKVHTQQLAVQLLYCLCRAHGASGNSHRGQDTRDSQSPKEEPRAVGAGSRRRLPRTGAESQRHHSQMLQNTDPAQQPSARISGRLRPCSQTASDETPSVLLQLAPCQHGPGPAVLASDTMALPAPTGTAGWLGLSGPGKGWDAEP